MNCAVAKLARVSFENDDTWEEVSLLPEYCSSPGPMFG